MPGEKTRVCSPQRPAASTPPSHPNPEQGAHPLVNSPVTQICPPPRAAVWGSGGGAVMRASLCKRCMHRATPRASSYPPGHALSSGRTIFTPPGVKLGTGDPQGTHGSAAICSEFSWWAHWPWPAVSYLDITPPMNTRWFLCPTPPASGSSHLREPCRCEPCPFWFGGDLLVTLHSFPSPLDLPTF